MHRPYLNTLVLTAVGAALLALSVSSPANAKDRLYHRVKNTDVIKIPGLAKQDPELREVGDAEANRLSKASPGSDLPSAKLEKYHQMDNTRIVWLLPNKPQNGFNKIR